MNPATSGEQLNRLLRILCRSFPSYVRYAQPWSDGSDTRVIEVLRQIASDQRDMARRISAAILAEGGTIDLGDFLMEFTDLNDLSAEYLLRCAVDYQKQDVAAIEDCANQLRLAPAALPLAEESLGMAQGHLEQLEALVRQPA